MRFLCLTTLACALTALCGCGKSASTGSTATKPPTGSQARVDNWTAELVSSGGCDRPDADVEVDKSNRFAITWVTPTSGVLPAPKAQAARIYACSRAIGKVFLLGNAEADHVSAGDQGSFSTDAATARRVDYTLQDATQSEDETAGYDEFTASLVSGKVRHTGEGSF
jgi:hypothetical protein